MSVDAFAMQPQPPKDFPVPEAFNSKNWKGQVAFTGSARVSGTAVSSNSDHSFPHRMLLLR